MSDSLVLRIQSAHGTKRVNASPTDTTKTLYEKIYETFQLPNYDFELYKNKGRKDVIHSVKTVALKSVGLNHGDTLYLEPIGAGFGNVNGIIGSSDIFDRNEEIESMDVDSNAGQSTPSRASTSSAGTSRASTSSKASAARASTGSNNAEIASSKTNVEEDEVDKELWKMSGKIKRNRDPKLCRHGSNACCIHCTPLEPFDPEYLKSQNVKHMSFHTYLRKLTAGVDRGKFALLEDVSCRIKEGCTGKHLPWPLGICSKCQPSALTLNRQVYRHVDNVMFENPRIVDSFLDYWRKTGNQRIGFLYGQYDVHADVPLGIRATVSAIYEPPQDSNRDAISLLPDPNKSLVDELASKLGLKCVGWIFTDLLSDDRQSGSVKCTRGIDTHFLSAQECIMAGHFQNENLNPCRYSPTGFYGSKFVTVCVTGDASNQIHMEGYTVSSQCMALVRDQILLPTLDCPELGYVRECSNQLYVPDVYYKETDRYNNEVQRLARPLPVEYLLIDVPASMPLEPVYTFPYNAEITQFPIENRLVDGQVQDFDALLRYLNQFTGDKFAEAINNFHVLLYIANNSILPLKNQMGPLLDAIRRNDKDDIIRWKQESNYSHLEQLLLASYERPSAPRKATDRSRLESEQDDDDDAMSLPFSEDEAEASDPSNMWICAHCTFLNDTRLTTCDMCKLPKS